MQSNLPASPRWSSLGVFGRWNEQGACYFFQPPRDTCGDIWKTTSWSRFIFSGRMSTHSPAVSIKDELPGFCPACNPRSSTLVLNATRSCTSRISLRRTATSSTVSTQSRRSSRSSPVRHEPITITPVVDEPVTVREEIPDVSRGRAGRSRGIRESRRAGRPARRSGSAGPPRPAWPASPDQRARFSRFEVCFGPDSPVYFRRNRRAGDR